MLMQQLAQDKQDRTSEAIAWAAANGFMVRANRDPTLFDHAPFTLYPTPYPAKLYKRAQSLSVPFNLLVDRVARDDAWLRATLQEAAAADPFVADQLKVYERVMEEGIAQQTYLGIHRSDYMIHVPRTNNVQDEGETKKEPNILQVELNTIAASFGCLSTKVSQMHRYLRTKAQLRNMTVDADELPVNDATAGLASAINSAHQQYKMQRACTTEPCVLFVVQDGETNTVDQRLFEFELTTKHGVAVLRRSLTSLSDSKCAALSKTNNENGKKGLNILMVEGHEISVVYYRAGYTPRDYPSNAEWAARLLVERSYAIKCPSIAYQLVGAKKVQQQLANSGELERFLSAEEGCAEARSTFAGLWQVDDASVAMVMEKNGVGYVMKPQREGGGNNIYNEEISKELKNMTKEERSAYIFMELIQPPEIQGTMVRSGKSGEGQGTLSELGIYSSFLGNGDSVYHSNYIGHLLRTKPLDATEGGVASGYSVLDSPRLVKEFVPEMCSA
jgi:glutathione synthase